MSAHNFKPAWWLKSAHLQTLWPALLRRNQSISLTRERVELADGDFIDIDWIGRDLRGPIILILHGFEGSIHSHYAKSMLLSLQVHQFRGVFMNFRGCSGEPNRLARSYHSGETGDVAEVVAMLQKREPHTVLGAIGFSLGGNILLKWLGETGEKNPLKAAIGISVPFELSKSSSRIDRGFSRVYQWYFLKCLRQRLLEKSSQVVSPIDLSILKSIHSLRSFDDQYTAPLHGFMNAEDYYQMTSCKPYLKKIKIPTLLLHAKDDPFMTEDMIPNTHDLSSAITLELTEKGGHVGFVSGKYPWRPRYWLETRIPLFLKDYLRG